MRFAVVKPVAATLVRELLIGVLLLLGVSLVVFAILYLAPGDPVASLLGGPTLSQGERAAAYEALGIPATWYGQYLSWVTHMLHGDFGTSLRSGESVARQIGSAGVNTLILTLGSLVVTLVLAVPVAVYAAVRPDSRSAWLLTMAIYVVSALPVFWLGYLAIYFFTHHFGVLPILSASTQARGLAWLTLLLPVLLLGVGNGIVSEVVRHLREEVTRVMNEEYIRTARAKGAAVWRHAYKEGLLLPVSEIIAAKMPFVLGGAIIVEQVFNWPGLGRLAWQAAQDRDFPVIMGIAITAAIVVRFGSLLQRVVYVALNPRASQE
jgi:peptide/nickel transport system permease protein